MYKECRSMPAKCSSQIVSNYTVDVHAVPLSCKWIYGSLLQCIQTIDKYICTHKYCQEAWPFIVTQLVYARCACTRWMPVSIQLKSNKRLKGCSYHYTSHEHEHMNITWTWIIVVKGKYSSFFEPLIMFTNL